MSPNMSDVSMTWYGIQSKIIILMFSKGFAYIVTRIHIQITGSFYIQHIVYFLSTLVDYSEINIFERCTGMFQKYENY